MTASTTRALAIVPARSGSKGLPDKNVRPFRGRPLLARTIDVALESGVFDQVVVSTDSEGYAAIARDAGARVPFLRPPELASDSACALDAYLYTLDRLASEHHAEFDLVYVLQPTSPLRSAQHLREVHAMLAAGTCDAVVSVTPLEHPLSWVNTLPEDRSMADFISTRNQRANRQVHEMKHYRLNGAIYAARSDVLREAASFYGSGTRAYVMPWYVSYDIDTLEDFVVAEAVARLIEEGGL